MKVILSRVGVVEIRNNFGSVRADWKTDLDEEEHEGYVPDGYETVLELMLVSAKKIGAGYGDRLMKQFLSSVPAKEADLIFLDPTPGIGSFSDSELTDDQQIAKLMKFYRQHGFRNNPRSNRMWLVRKGSIPDSRLPT